ncbi:hypothetical protein [Chelativorans alearense]|uniref:hypothetical protein n=1 Tax=Chelativorans alearense TaxID=2681495 RepID=UPI0013CFF9BC|nr:hypothetical protein [Chelativorans alearense]
MSSLLLLSSPAAEAALLSYHRLMHAPLVRIYNCDNFATNQQKIFARASTPAGSHPSEKAEKENANFSID